MKPVKTKHTNVEVAKDQEEYQTLPAHIDYDDPKATITCCWELTERELEQIQETGKLHIQIMTFGNPMQPILPTVEDPLEPLIPTEATNGS